MELMIGIIVMMLMMMMKMKTGFVIVGLLARWTGLIILMKVLGHGLESGEGRDCFRTKGEECLTQGKKGGRSLYICLSVLLPSERFDFEKARRGT